MTNAGIFGQRGRVAILAFVLLAAPMAHMAVAQDRPGPAVDLAAGWVGFADDGIVSEGLIGGAARWYLLPRFSIGPELVFIHGPNHSHLIVTGNVTWDVLAPRNRRPRAVTPFLVAGGGVFRTNDHLFNGIYTSSEGAFTAGGGVRALVANRVTLGLEMRVGWEPHLRINGLIGLQLGR
ncbi:MAG: hypothetical protein ABMA15_08290 [Vicinamibacterales bacterium]